MNNCQQCGKKCNRKFCSISCSNKYWNPITKTGKTAPNAKRAKIITIKLNCLKCGNEFEITTKQSLIDRGVHKKYCSNLCSHSREVSVETKQKISNGVNAFNASLPTKQRKLRYKTDDQGNRLNKPRLRIRYLSKKICIVCGNNIERHSEKYCSQECNIFHNKSIKLQSVANGKCTETRQLKKYLIHINGHQCSICKNTEWMGGPIPLVMDHIDGRSNNNALENLRLVCGNCDMKLPTYKSKNKNSDRKNRKKYYSDETILEK